MSKIIELIHATPTDRRAAGFLPFISSVAHIDESYISVGMDTEYKITAELGAKVWVSEETIAYGALEHAVLQVKRKVAEAIFGEFRESIHDIRHSLFNREYEKVNQKLNSLERQMFSYETT